MKRLSFVLLASLVVVVSGAFADGGRYIKKVEDKKEAEIKEITNNDSIDNTDGIIINAKSIPFLELLEILRKNFNIYYSIVDYDRSLIPQNQEQESKGGATRNDSGTIISTVLLQAPQGGAVGQSNQSQNANTKDKSGSINYVSDLTLTLSKKITPDKLQQEIEDICNIANVSCKYDPSRKFLRVSRLDVAIIERPFFGNFSFSENLGSPTSSASTQGGMQSSAQQTGTQQSTSNIRYSTNYANFINAIGNLLSDEGKIVVNETAGIVYIVDRPLNIMRVKEILEEEQAKTAHINLSVKILRIDYNDNISYGVDWTAMIGETVGIVGGGAAVSSQSGVLGSINIQTSKLNFLMNAMERFGKVNIVHSWKSTVRSGMPTDFRDIGSIPYVVPQTTSNQSGVVITYEPRFVDVGVKLNIVPSLLKEKKEILGQVYLEASQLLRFVTYPVDNQGNTLSVPETKATRATIPFRAKLGESVIITGFRITRDEKNSQGFPLLSRIPVLGGLFGFNQSLKGDSEIVFIIEPSIAEGT